MSTNETTEFEPTATTTESAIDPEAAARAAATTVLEKLPLARLYLVFTEIDDSVLDAALRGGVDMAELICGSQSDEQLVATGRHLKQICDGHAVPFMISARADLVEAIGADGVHLSQGDDVEAARALVGPDRIIGLSTHTEEEVVAAEWAGVDYISIGPVNRTWYAPDKPAIGTKLLTFASRNINLPFFAVGGIQVENTGAVAAAGAQRIAVSRAITTSHAPDRAAAFIRDEVMHPSDFLERYRARTESQNAAARAKLTPLQPGERPPALLFSIALTLVAGLVNLIGFTAGLKVEGDRPKTYEIIIFAVIAFLLSYGMWKRVYQALMLFMAILSMVVVLFALFLIEASNLLGVVVGLVVCFGGGTLLWKLVRVAGRMQAPVRPAPPPRS